MFTRVSVVVTAILLAIVALWALNAALFRQDGGRTKYALMPRIDLSKHTTQINSRDFKCQNKHTALFSWATLACKICNANITQNNTPSSFLFPTFPTLRALYTFICRVYFEILINNSSHAFRMCHKICAASLECLINNRFSVRLQNYDDCFCFREASELPIMANTSNVVCVIFHGVFLTPAQHAKLITIVENAACFMQLMTCSKVSPVCVCA